MNLKTYALFAAALMTSVIQAQNASSFLSKQMQFERVRQAKAEKEPVLKNLFAKLKLSYPPQKIFLRIFKREKLLECWVQPSINSSYILLDTYQICSVPGVLGPKRRQGDSQVPEGFYWISEFNPSSRFHLSLRINYPNDSDRILSSHKDLGGEIYIHGDCVSIGCAPITDDKIKEVYILSILARSNGQKNIPVHIFPCHLTDDALKELEQSAGHDDSLSRFWKNLKIGYDFFETRKIPPGIQINSEGIYSFY